LPAVLTVLAAATGATLAGAAFIVSLLAMLIAGASAVFSWQQRRINAERLRDERRPVLAAAYIPPDRAMERPRPAIRIENQGTVGYWRVDGRVIIGTEPAEDGTDQPIVLGLYDPADGQPKQQRTLGKLDIGERLDAEFVVPSGPFPPRGGIVRLVVTCHGVGERKPWSATVECRFPQPPMVAWG
jgi:hypothetical protein